MSTRFYLQNGTIPDVTPLSWDASWNYQSAGGTWTYKAVTTAGTTAITYVDHANDATATARFGSTLRFVTDPLAAQSLSGNISGQMQCAEGGAANNATLAIAITVINSAGTQVATLLAVSASDNTTTTPPEISAVANVNRQFQNSAEATSIALTNHDCALDDRIVIEIGVREVRASNGETLIFGDDAPLGDLPIDNTTTWDETPENAYRPWVEFSNTITFAPTTTSVTNMLSLLGVGRTFY